MQLRCVHPQTSRRARTEQAARPHKVRCVREQVDGRQRARNVARRTECEQAWLWIVSMGFGFGCASIGVKEASSEQASQHPGRAAVRGRDVRRQRPHVRDVSRGEERDPHARGDRGAVRRGFRKARCFRGDGTDDGFGTGTSRIRADGTILVSIALPPGVTVLDDPARDPGDDASRNPVDDERPAARPGADVRRALAGPRRAGAHAITDPGRGRGDADRGAARGDRGVQTTKKFFTSRRCASGRRVARRRSYRRATRRRRSAGARSSMMCR